MRTPKTNSMFIKKYYKPSTIPRLKYDWGYKNQININKCPIITRWLDKCYELGNTGYVQDEMFKHIYFNRKINYKKLSDYVVIKNRAELNENTKKLMSKNIYAFRTERVNEIIEFQKNIFECKLFDSNEWNLNCTKYIYSDDIECILEIDLEIGEVIDIMKLQLDSRTMIETIVDYSG
ncbi:MAG: hypothetical protein RLZZ500_1920 [Bacteroidota bacterium]